MTDLEAAWEKGYATGYSQAFKVDARRKAGIATPPERPVNPYRVRRLRAFDDGEGSVILTSALYDTDGGTDLGAS